MKRWSKRDPHRVRDQATRGSKNLGGEIVGSGLINCRVARV